MSVFLRGFQSLMGALFPIVFPRVFNECVFLYCGFVISMGARAVSMGARTVIPVIFMGAFFRTVLH